MNELNDIKARAVARRDDPNMYHSDGINAEAEDDLDLAIAIAEQNDTLARENRKLVLTAWKERDKAIDAAKALRDIVKRLNKYPREDNELTRVLADTASLDDR